MLTVREEKDGVVFWIEVKPRSRKNEIVDVREGALRLRITAPPLEGAANEACRKLLSKILGISKTSITIKKGETAHKKLIHCRNLTTQDILARIPL